MKHFDNRSKHWLLLSVAIATNLFFLHNALVAQEHTDKLAATKPDHILISPENVKWTDGPSALPPGAKFSVIEGDPAAPGLFAMRVKLPAGYKIAAHWHPADEHVTVISGAFMMGLGDVFESAKLTSLSAGSFAVMTAKTRHFAATNEETIVQIHGIGPWGINYVNPDDDPRKKH